MRFKVLLLVVVLLLLGGAAAALGFAWPFGQRPDTLRVSGVVEIQEVHLGPRVGGRVAEVLVQEGDVVKAGQPLVRLEVPELEAQREVLLAKLSEAQAEYAKAANGPRREELRAAEAAIDVARARWDRLREGPRVEDIDAARSELGAARADAELAKREMARAERLVRSTAASRAEYDTAQMASERARARTQTARARLALLEAGSRVEDVDEAKAELDRLKAQYRLLLEGTRSEEVQIAQARLSEAQRRVGELDVNLREATVRAAEPASVEVVSVRPGALVSANQPVVRVLRRGDLWVKTYVPETLLGKVRLGQAVKVSMDSYPGRQFDGKVVHINSESEFTPRNVQTVDERRHQLFGVRVRVDDPQGAFKAGMAAEVHVPLAAE